LMVDETTLITMAATLTCTIKVANVSLVLALG